MTASEIRALFAVASRPEVVSLAGGMPNLAALPLETLAGEVAELVARDGQVALQYGSAQGVPALREQICEVMALEGIRADPNDVVVTSARRWRSTSSRGSLRPRRRRARRGTVYVGALGSFAAYQARVVHVAMDAHGLCRSCSAMRAAPSPPAASSRSSSTRSRTSTTRPAPPWRWSAARGAGHLRRVRHRGAGGQPLRPARVHRPGLPGAALHDPDVIYLGSFSKTFASGLRVGWALVPPAVRDRLVLAAESATLCPPTFNQLLVSRYLAATTGAVRSRRSPRSTASARTR
jgi:DNA-binding transcriptional MocR family regulator